MCVTQTTEDFVSFDETLAAITTKIAYIINGLEVNNNDIDNIIQLHSKPLQKKSYWYFVLNAKISSASFKPYSVSYQQL